MTDAPEQTPNPAPQNTTPATPAGEPDVSAVGLVKVYGTRTVVNGISINARCGECVGLLGPNGAGKTTTFYMVVGLVRPNAGTVRFRGQDITHMPVYKRARIGLGYLAREALQGRETGTTGRAPDLAGADESGEAAGLHAERRRTAQVGNRPSVGAQARHLDAR